jgi:hypothetical protein
LRSDVILTDSTLATVAVREHAVELALDLVEAAEDQGEAVVGGHGSLRGRGPILRLGASEDGA